MPAYNHARWIRQAMESVLAQTFTDFEFIVIDDASSDASWELIRSVCDESRDLRLQCIRHHHNQGASATINEGLRHAQGEYLTIINSDDVWEPDRLKRLLQVADTGEPGFISTDVSLLDADSNTCDQQESHWIAWFEALKQDYAQHGDILATLLRGNCLITTSNFFFHRRVYERVGEFAELRYLHDYDFVLRVLAIGFNVQFLSGEKLLGYRLHNSNTIREKPLAAIEENTQLLLGWLPCLDGLLNEQRLLGLQFQLQSLFRYMGEEWQTTVHNQLVAKEQELFPLIADRDRWIAERDALLSEQRQLLEQHQTWVADRDRWIAERDDLIQQQAAWLAERESWVADRDCWIRDRDGWIAERDDWIAERDGWIRDRDLFIRHLQQQQQELRNSRAFRLGESLLAPLRYFGQFAKGVGYARKTDSA